MKSIYTYSLLIALTAVITACKKPYLSPPSSTSNSYLVVEGVINSGGDSTIIKLSKTVQLSGNVKSAVLNNCVVTVEDEQGVSAALKPAEGGRYVAALSIDAAKKYRLHIVAGNDEYASDYIAVKPTPPIDAIQFDSVKYNDNNNKYVQTYVTTHDAGNNTRYYRWECIETWKIMSFFESFYIVDGNKIRERTPDEQSTVCFETDTSGSIYIGTSVKLAQDVINRSPVVQIPHQSLKLKYRYSLLVKQYALSKDEYQFWQNLQKNTEQLGSIFDAQPSQLNGNIHNVKKPAEPVIGYVSITNVQTKRIFIAPIDVPANGIAAYPYPDCKIDTVLYNPAQPYGPPGCVYACIIPNGNVVSELIDGRGLVEPVLPIPAVAAPYIVGWQYSTLACVDCRVRGTNVKPPYWDE